jgi:hypothetical protein
MKTTEAELKPTPSGHRKTQSDASPRIAEVLGTGAVPQAAKFQSVSLIRDLMWFPLDTVNIGPSSRGIVDHFSVSPCDVRACGGLNRTPLI